MESNSASRGVSPIDAVLCVVRQAAERAGRSIARRWSAYWDYQARCATAMTLKALDDRTLADIGLRRSEIEEAAFGKAAERAGACTPFWPLHVR